MPQYYDNSVQAIFTSLLEQKNFGEVILVGWAYVEYIIDLTILYEFKAINADEIRKEFLTRGTFEQKWQSIKKLDIFTTEEKTKITRFQKQRNRMFHKVLFNKEEYYSPQGKEKLMSAASDAFWAEHDGFTKKYVGKQNFY